MYVRPDVSNANIFATWMDAVGQEHHHHRGIGVAPQARAREAEMAEGTSAEAPPRRRPLRRLAIEARAQRPTGTRCNQHSRLLRSEPVLGPAPERVQHGSSETTDGSGRPEQA